MSWKKIVVSFILLSPAFLCTGCFSKKNVAQVPCEQEISLQKQNLKVNIQSVPKEKKFDLYSTTPYEIPLYSIEKISKLPLQVKLSVDKLLESSQGFYFLKEDQGKLLVILQNPVTTNNTFPRHELQLAEIDPEGNIKYHTAGYSGKNNELIELISIKNQDEWFFDESSEQIKPLKHVVYNEKGKVKYSEYWNYDKEDPIKYQMKDSNKNLLSILKEVQDGDANYRKEHIFYDNEGNTVMSLSVNYEGANITRLTYYNAHDSIDSISILTEYTDGYKTKELVYNENYELINKIECSYINGERKSIVVYDKDNNIVNKISS